MNEPVLNGEDELLRQAKNRVARKMAFYVHALVFVLVNLGLFLLNQFTGNTRWHQWPLWGWGLGLAIHGVVTFLSLYSDGWREDMVAKEVERLRKRP
jgi:steroid 5-alpha reductase family enzyme